MWEQVVELNKYPIREIVLPKFWQPQYTRNMNKKRMEAQRYKKLCRLPHSQYFVMLWGMRKDEKGSSSLECCRNVDEEWVNVFSCSKLRGGGGRQTDKGRERGLRAESQQRRWEPRKTCSVEFWKVVIFGVLQLKSNRSKFRLSPD